MSQFKKLFNLFRKPHQINAATAKIDEQVYLINYRDHYADILGDQINSHRLAELFLFRAWTAQFGYRISSTNPDASEKLIGETVNPCKYLGLGLFEQLHGFSVESELGSEFVTLIGDRWNAYDLIVSTTSATDRIPATAISSSNTNRLNVWDPIVTFKLSMDSLRQLDLIKRTAMEIGVLRVQV